MRRVLHSGAPALLGIVLLLGTAAPAWAVYKVVGPDGSVTFTDVPPSSAHAAVVPDVAATPASELPRHLRELQRNAPVVIYTTPDCKACDAGVQLLRKRGIPYAEKTIVTPQDAQALKAMDPSMELPLLSVAGVDLSPGLNSGAWEQALNAAGYPRRSELPGSYRFAIPQSLVPAQSGAPAPGAAPVPAPSRAAAPAQPPVVAPPDPNAPPGFKF